MGIPPKTGEGPIVDKPRLPDLDLHQPMPGGRFLTQINATMPPRPQPDPGFDADRKGLFAMDDSASGGQKKTWTEEVEVAGSQLLERVKELIAEGRVRRLRIKAADGSLILEIPLAVGAIAGGAVALAAPLLAVLGAFAALVARAKVEIVRDEQAASASGTPPTA